MGITKKIRTLHNKIGEIRFLFLCLALWVVLFSSGLLISGNAGYVSGFLLGATGSAWYAYLLYRRVPVMLNRPLLKRTTPPREKKDGAARPASLQYLWLGWLKIMMPIAAITLIILGFSHFLQNISFPAALFGFFSFQISLFLYAILISVLPNNQVKV